jgi:hypothetical protein
MEGDRRGLIGHWRSQEMESGVMARERKWRELRGRRRVSCCRRCGTVCGVILLWCCSYLFKGDV